MKYILIDTNCWLNFLHSHSEQKLVAQLEYWIQEGFVTLFIPSRLSIEWDKRKKEHLNAAEIQYKKEFEDADPQKQFMVNARYSLVSSRAEKIDQLFNRGIALAHSKEVAIDVIRRFDNDLAPFHAKSKSNADALIYLSTIEYCQENSIRSFFFFTKNKDDFGDPRNITRKIHPDLRFDGIDTLYFIDPFFAFNELGKELPAVEIKNEGARGDYFRQFDLRVSKQSNALVDELFESLDRYHDQLPFIPLDILCRVYPFKIIDTEFNHSYYSTFNLATNNHDVFQLFNNIEIGADNKITVNDSFYTGKLSMLEEILWKLHHNIVNSIQSITQNEHTSIHLNSDKICSCCKCSYKKIDFFQALQSLSSPVDESYQERLKIASIHFHFGNFYTALKIFYHIYLETEKNGKFILNYIALQNCKTVQYHIEAYFSNYPSEITGIILSIQRITLREKIIASTYETEFVQENIRWIAEKKYYQKAFVEISELLRKVREHYELQLTGGWSSNNHLGEIISVFLEYELFLESNCLLYDTFHEIRNLFDYLLRALLMTHQFNKRQRIRQIFFDSYWLEKTVLYAYPGRLHQYLDQFSIDNLRYRDGSSETFITRINKFFTSDTALQQLITEKVEDRAYYLQNKYYDVWANVLILLSVLDCDSSEFQELILGLFSNEAAIQSVNPGHVVYLSRLLYAKGKYLTKNVLHDLIILFINNKSFHKPDFFKAIKGLINEHFAGFCIEDEATYHAVVENFFNICPKCNQVHDSQLLIILYELLTDDFKKNLRATIDSSLAANFNLKLYYDFCIYDVIDFKPQFSQFLGATPVPSPENINASTYEREEAKYDGLNRLINIAFKYQLDLKGEPFVKFKGISNYYDWLLDMEGFNYNSFEPEWILEYPTWFFLKRIFANSAVLGFLQPWLTKNNQPRLKSLYVEYAELK